MQTLLNTIKEKIDNSKHSVPELIQGAFIIAKDIFIKKSMTEEEVTNLCACLLKLYMKQEGIEHGSSESTVSERNDT